MAAKWPHGKALVIVTLVLVSMLFLSCTQSGAPGGAAAYPSKLVELTLNFDAGSGTDATARAMIEALKAENLLPSTGMTIVTENVGASGAVGFPIYAQVRNNPHKLLFSPRIVMLNYLMGKANAGPLDITPIAQLVTTYGAITVRDDSPYKTLKDLIDALKKDPGSVKFIGSMPPASDWNTLAITMLASGIPLDKINYAATESGAAALPALLGGHADAMPAGPEDVKGHPVRLLAVSSRQRLPDYPDVPTISEVVGKEAVFMNWRSLFGPKDMPAENVKWWRDALDKMTKTQRWKDAAVKLGASAAYEGEGFAKFLEQDEKDSRVLLTAVGMIK